MNRLQWKYLAALAMLVDHIGMLFLPIATPAGVLCRVIGRLTAPVMAYFLAQGYFHTSSVRRYAGRLLLFAVLSQVPYAFVHGNSILTPDFNVLFTWFLSVLILCVYDSSRSPAFRAVGIGFLLILSVFCDWGVIVPLWVLGFYHFRQDRRGQLLSFCVIGSCFVLMAVADCILRGAHWYGQLWQTGVFLFLLCFFFCREGNRAGDGVVLPSRKYGGFHKWFFYGFYPLHLLLLGILVRLLG